MGVREEGKRFSFFSPSPLYSRARFGYMLGELIQIAKECVGICWT